MEPNGEPVQTGNHDQESHTREMDDDPPSENTPLLAREGSASAHVHGDSGSIHDNARPTQPERYASAYSLLNRLRGGSKDARRRWPSILALSLLCLLVLLIMLFAFFTPSIVKQYASEAVVFEPSSLSVESFTPTGVQVRIQGNFMMDATRVKSKPVRDLGKFGTWIAGSVKSGQSEVEVSLPEYGNVMLGTAEVPSIKLDIRNGHRNALDFLSDLQPGDVDGIRRIANDWIDGRLGQLRVLGKAHIPIKSGILSLGKQLVEHELLFASKDIPSIPGYDIKKLNIREIEGEGMVADVSLWVQNEYPLDLTVPELGFGILVENCRDSDEPYILVADALTHELHIQPHANVEVNVTGTIRELPPLLTQNCPGSHSSPLDDLLAKYIHGKETTIYVQGAKSPSPDTPRWITDLMANIILPVPLPGRTLGHLIKNFTLADTHFSLPDPWADPDTPESNPRLSAKVRVLAALPEEMNFNVSVARVRADADVFYKDQKLGVLNLDKWQKANSSRVEAEDGDKGPMLLVESFIKDAPLNITDEDVFTEVLQQLIFGKGVMMKIKAAVSVGVNTALGNLTIHDIPAEGQVPVKPISRQPGQPGHGNGGLDTGVLNPKINDILIGETTENSLSLRTSVNISNPTPYTATIPYFDVHILKNGSLLGNVTVQNLSISLGNNTNLLAGATYAPLLYDGPVARAVGRELISEYISGRNTSITLQLHEQSIPSLPALGRALAKFPLNITIPHLRAPSGGGGGDNDGDDGDGSGRPRFIQGTTMHVFSSTATFLLLSPLRHATLYIERINATAFDNDAAVPHRVGTIFYDGAPFGVPPLADTPGRAGFLTPRLPVDWSLGSVGYDAVLRAIGGELKLAAYADVNVRLGRWREQVWFAGRGIGASVRP